MPAKLISKNRSFPDAGKLDFQNQLNALKKIRKGNARTMHKTEKLWTSLKAFDHLAYHTITDRLITATTTICCSEKKNFKKE